ASAHLERPSSSDDLRRDFHQESEQRQRQEDRRRGLFRAGVWRQARIPNEQTSQNRKGGDSPLMTAPLQEKITDVDDARDKMIEDFEASQSGLSDNSAYYDAERRPEAIGITVPVEMQKLLAHVGYPRLY